MGEVIVGRVDVGQIQIICHLLQGLRIHTGQSILSGGVVFDKAPAGIVHPAAILCSVAEHSTLTDQIE